MENYNWSDIKGNPDAPYINHSLLPLASYAEHYFNPPSVHPSESNYLWLEAGTNFGIWTTIRRRQIIRARRFLASPNWRRKILCFDRLEFASCKFRLHCA